MYKIKFQEERKFTGTYLSVPFANGEGETDNAYLAERFEKKGLIVEDATPIENPYTKMKTAELEAAAAELDVDISDCKNNKEKAVRLFEVFQAQKAGEGEPPQNPEE